MVVSYRPPTTKLHSWNGLSITNPRPTHGHHAEPASYGRTRLSALFLRYHRRPNGHTNPLHTSKHIDSESPNFGAIIQLPQLYSAVRGARQWALKKNRLPLVCYTTSSFCFPRLLLHLHPSPTSFWLAGLTKDPRSISASIIINHSHSVHHFWYFGVSFFFVFFCVLCYQLTKIFYLPASSFDFISCCSHFRRVSFGLVWNLAIIVCETICLMLIVSNLAA